MSGFFISVEGVEGAGKSSCIVLIENHLQEHGIEYVITREPGGTELGEKIRALLLSPEYDIDKDTELLLMCAARNEHVKNIIVPALSAGKLVLCDRFMDASYAYQGGGRNIPEQHIQYIERWLLAGLTPNLTLLLDLPVELGLKRIEKRGALDRIEQENHQFFKRIRQVYLKRAQAEPERFVIVDASQTITHVEQAIKKTLQQRLPCG